MEGCAVGNGIKLRDCLHQFCKECVVGVVQNGTECEIKCPYVNEKNENCIGIIQEREIYGVLTVEQFDIYMQRTSRLNLQMVPNMFKCRTVNCVGSWPVEAGDVDFKCELCQKTNCLKCKVR